MIRKHLLLLAWIGLVSVPASYVFADHGSGGGCSGDCTPPTLGEDNSGRVFVDDGFGLNGQFFDVSGFQQDLTSQDIEIGRPVDVTIRVYENEGVQSLVHAGLTLGAKTELVGATNMETYQAEILWDRNIGGGATVQVHDNDRVLGDVGVSAELGDDAFGGPEAITVLTFTFTPLSYFEINPIVVNVWDQSRNSWKNYFYNAAEIVGTADSILGDVELEDPERRVLSIPGWIRTSAHAWSEGIIDDDAFAQGIAYCIGRGIINIPDLPVSSAETLPFVDPARGAQYYLDRYYNEPVYREWFDENFPGHTIEEAVGITGAKIPSWIRDSAGAWADGMIPDAAFAAGIKHLIEHGIIRL